MSAGAHLNMIEMIPGLNGNRAIYNFGTLIKIGYQWRYYKSKKQKKQKNYQIYR